MHLKSRYDILLGRPGAAIDDFSDCPFNKDRVVVHGPRRSGRTFALLQDMETYASKGHSVCFFSINEICSARVRNSTYLVNFDRVSFLTYSNYNRLRGLTCRGLYLDDFSREAGCLRAPAFDIIFPLFSRADKVVIASLTKDLPIDTTGWTFKALSPRP